MKLHLAHPGWPVYEDGCGHSLCGGKLRPVVRDHGEALDYINNNEIQSRDADSKWCALCLATLRINQWRR